MFRFLSAFAPQQKLVFFLLIVLGLVQAAVDAAGVATAGLFALAITNPDQVLTNSDFVRFYEYFFSGTPGTSDAIIIATLLFTGLLVIRNIGFLLLEVGKQVFVRRALVHIQKELFYSYLSRPFLDIKSRTSAQVSRDIVEEPKKLIVGIVLAWVTIILDIFIVVAIQLYLLWHDPVVTIAATLGVAAIAVAFLAFIRPRAAIVSKKSRAYWSNILQETIHAFRGAKEIKVLQRERQVIETFGRAVRASAGIQMRGALYKTVAKPIFEIAVALMLLAGIIVQVLNGGDFSAFLPTLSIFAVAALRLLPTMTRIVSSFTSLNLNKATLDGLLKELADRRDLPAIDVDPLPFSQGIELKNVSYSYPQKTKEAAVLKDINLKIGRAQMVGVVGETGSGKSTLMDIILGLIDPSEGELLVDGQKINAGNMSRWRKNLAYVPQEIFIANTTIFENVVWGLEDHQKNQDRVKEVLVQAQLLDQVEQMSDGLAHKVGDFGAALSGGQRQRLGIARALYTGAPVILMDEATSALDGATEAKIEQCLTDISANLTHMLIMIAHRINTLRRCDFILVLDKGRIADKGTYDELMARSDLFRALAREYNA